MRKKSGTNTNSECFLFVRHEANLRSVPSLITTRDSEPLEVKEEVTPLNLKRHHEPIELSEEKVESDSKRLSYPLNKQQKLV